MGFTRKPNKLFTEEVFGAEYEEGISGMKNWKMGFLPRIRYAMKPDEAYGLVLSWDNVVVSLLHHLCVCKFDTRTFLFWREVKISTNDINISFFLIQPFQNFIAVG
ncbi:unnamed protein product [Brassica rapa subsp. narinosa]